MLFSAGLASDILYWGAAEPITHFADNPFYNGDPETTAAAIKGITVTFSPGDFMVGVFMSWLDWQLALVLIGMEIL